MGKPRCTCAKASQLARVSTTVRPGLVAETQALPSLADALDQRPSLLWPVREDVELAHLAASLRPTQHSSRAHIQSHELDGLRQARPPILKFDAGPTAQPTIGACRRAGHQPQSEHGARTESRALNRPFPFQPPLECARRQLIFDCELHTL